MTEITIAEAIDIYEALILHNIRRFDYITALHKAFDFVNDYYHDIFNALED